MSQQTLTITARQLRALVGPVLPSAGADDMLPILTAVRIETRGGYLTAVATDRFVVAMQRMTGPEGGWPEFAANVPTSVLKTILATFKPSRRDSDPELTLTLLSDTAFRVTGSGSLLDMQEATVTYPLMTGEYPKVTSLLVQRLEAKATDDPISLDPKKIARLLSGSSAPAVRMHVTGAATAVVLTDGEDWLAAIMPRKLLSGREYDVVGEWMPLLAPAVAEKAAS